MLQMPRRLVSCFVGRRLLTTQSSQAPVKMQMTLDSFHTAVEGLSKLLHLGKQSPVFC
jgi:hypothetical protein